MNRDLNDTMVFVKVVELGSFTAAANTLHMPKATVSRRVQELEERLGAQLLHRTTRKLGLTEAGNIYFAHCQRIARDLDEAESAVGQLQSGPRGWLRVTASHPVGNTWVAPLLSEFHARHPGVRVELLLSNDQVDIIAGEIDVALRVGALADSNLAARKLAVFHTAIYAAPSYIARFSEPMHPDDLIHHRATVQTNHRSAHGFAWTLDDGNGNPHEFPVDPVMIASDPSAVRTVMLDGEGLMLTSDVYVRALVEQGLVQRVLPGWRGMDVDLHALFPRGQVQSPKVRAFVDFLVERLNIEESYLEVLNDDTARGQRPAAAREARAKAVAERHQVLSEVAPKAAPAVARVKGKRSRTLV
ncbi:MULTISPECIES: LysR family transcriptional regulator [unclassified Achromobacter]|uniref:LysR family transcriptional regulator n=1 Tax=unclassified Achromobacter TaxID=2626865 RepID=UPI000B519D27|nr:MULTISPECIES: LysR family transcriptional regulator [unclassified Achromobacter]OWT77027.1 LysR family transcriptional regulator [Achromobacter sp. HZ28]OWT77908.1 LysR family transcriptional regulator [Achromobacter sp. HZ34]